MSSATLIFISHISFSCLTFPHLIPLIFINKKQTTIRWLPNCCRYRIYVKKTCCIDYLPLGPSNLHTKWLTDRVTDLFLLSQTHSLFYYSIYHILSSLVYWTPYYTSLFTNKVFLTPFYSFVLLSSAKPTSFFSTKQNVN